MKLSRQRRTRRPFIVWLDDQMPLLLELVGHLNARGYDVLPTSSVTGFLRAIQDQSVNIAIIDIKLGGGEDGTALIDLLYDNRPEMGILVHSSFPDAFLPTRYDEKRVRFVQKDQGDDPVKIDDTWPLADTLTGLVDTLNERQAGLASYPVAIVAAREKKRPLGWPAVHRLQQFALEHVMLAFLGLLLIVKIVVIAPSTGVELDTALEYLWEVGGFVLPFALFVTFAWLCIPAPIKEARSPADFIQKFLDRTAVDPEFRSSINREISACGLPVPADDFSALASYYNILTLRRLWLARALIALFVVGAAYLGYDIVHDLTHLGPRGHG